MDIRLLDQQGLKTLLHVTPAAKQVLQSAGPLEIQAHLSQEGVSVVCTGQDAFCTAAKEAGLQLRMTLLKDSFEVRSFRYESLHAVEEADMEALVESLRLKPKSAVLDLMCGYGAVSEAILRYAEKQKMDIELSLCDLHATQMERISSAVRTAAQVVKVGDARHPPFPDNYFDAVVIKMGVHDVPRFDQFVIFHEVFRMLKPGGRFAIWDLMFDDAEMQDAFQDIIRKKDELAGYESYLWDRYFFRETQARQLFVEAGFCNVQRVREVRYLQSSLKRRDAEFGGNQKKFETFNRYIEQRIIGPLREKMQLRKIDSDVQFIVPNRIMLGHKNS